MIWHYDRTVLFIRTAYFCRLDIWKMDLPSHFFISLESYFTFYYYYNYYYCCCYCYCYYYYYYYYHHYYYYYYHYHYYHYYYSYFYEISIKVAIIKFGYQNLFVIKLQHMRRFAQFDTIFSI